MNELLSICIPTRNRARYLSELLLSIEKDVLTSGINQTEIKIYISDNASSDNTSEVVKRYQNKNLSILYFRNPRNIGGDANFLYCVKIAKGNYIWLVGDDELICPGALSHILEILKKIQPALFINNSGHSKLTPYLPAVFEDYRSFVKYFIKIDPFIPLSHSLITYNIFKSTSFDYNFAEKMLSTHYGHMYGLISGLTKNPDPVYITNVQTILIRDERAPLENVNQKIIYQSWLDYLKWLKSYLNLEELNPQEIIRKATYRNMYEKIKLFCTHHPFWPFIKPIKKRCEKLFFKNRIK